MCDYQPCEKESQTNMWLINSKVYYLNKSQSKYITVGLTLSDFKPSLLFGGNNCKTIALSEEDWNSLLKYQDVITSYFYSCNSLLDPIEERNFIVTFEKIKDTPVIRFKHNDYYIFLGSQSVYCLWQIIPVIEYRLDILRKQKFNTYFNVLVSNIENHQGNILDRVFSAVSSNQNPNSENVSTMLELLHIYPEELKLNFKNSSSKRRFYENEQLEANLRNSSSKRKYYEEISNN